LDPGAFQGAIGAVLPYLPEPLDSIGDQASLGPVPWTVGKEDDPLVGLDVPVDDDKMGVRVMAVIALVVDGEKVRYAGSGDQHRKMVHQLDPLLVRKLSGQGDVDFGAEPGVLPCPALQGIHPSACGAGIIRHMPRLDVGSGTCAADISEMRASRARRMGGASD